MSSRGALAVAGAIGVLALAQPAGAASTSTLLFHLRGAQLDEISGVATGLRSPDVLYVQNDSGDSARFFALDATSGRVLAQYAVPGAVNVDWEDIAVARDARGVPSVWLADIGDNDAQRGRVELYRVDEPSVPAAGHDAQLATSPPQVWRLTYPDGAHDAESLAVTPRGVPYVVTKSLSGASEVFAASPRPGKQRLRKVGTIQFGLTGTPGPFAPIGQLAATGADISRDGKQLVVRTYTDAYLWAITDGDVAVALRSNPRRISLPEQPQGEGICFDGPRLLIDSEHVGSAVYALPLPQPARPPSSPRLGPSVTAPATAEPSSRPNRWWVGGAAAGLVLAIAVSGVLHRRRHGQLE